MKKDYKILSNNPVAKFSKKFNKATIHVDKKKESKTNIIRKRKHKNECE